MSGSTPSPTAALPSSHSPALTAIVESFKRAILDAYGSREAFPYHNPEDHISMVVETAQRIMDHLHRNGVSFDPLVVTASAWGHDALFGLDSKIFGFESSEALAAHYSKQRLIKLGAPEHFAHAVADTIAATAPGVAPRTTEAKILRAADLANLGADYDTFRNNTRLLFTEKINRGIPISFEHFVNGSLRYLSLYLGELIELTENATDSAGRSNWHTATIRNLCRLWHEAHASAPVHVVCNGVSRDIFAGEYSTAVAPALFIEAYPASMLQMGSRYAPDRHQAFSSKHILLRVPGMQHALPLPDRIASHVFTISSEERVLAEAARICAPDGRIILIATDEWKAASAMKILVQLGFEASVLPTPQSSTLRSEWRRIPEARLHDCSLSSPGSSDT